MRKKLVGTIGLCGVLLACFMQPTAAHEPYENYTYKSNGELKNEPQAYTMELMLDGAAMGAGSLSEPSDICEGADGRLYIADTGNNRIVVLDRDFRFVRSIETFQNGETQDEFRSPQGVFVTGENLLYVADTENERIVSLTAEGVLCSVYAKPELPTGEESFSYKPVRVSVDSSGRMFVVSRNMNKGMIELDREGNFTSFFGAVEVEKNFFDLIWSNVLTQEQLDRSAISVPTEYAACDIDSEGFVYGTVSATGRQTSGEIFIRRLNPSGVDVLKRNGPFPPRGDITTTLNSQGVSITSRLNDISVGESGMYSVLDTLRGRVFVYDQEGYLLYVFGSLGKSSGAMMAPRALEWLESGCFAVADGQLNALLIYRATPYAELIYDATIAQYNRQYAAAQEKWQEVLAYSSFSEIAYVGMGKALYRQRQYQESMYYFKLGGNRTLYSKAFGKHSGEIVAAWFLPVVYLLAGAAALYGGWRLYRAVRKRRSGPPKQKGV